MRWQMQDSNLLLRILLDGSPVSKKEIEEFKSTNTFIWQRRTDVTTAWIYELEPHKVEWNDIERDILYRLLETNS